MAKIFGIGLGKTGTKSLAMALRMLGYNIKHQPHSLDFLANRDGAVDGLMPYFVDQLAILEPNASYIYTTRHETEWLNSWVKHDALVRSKLTDLQKLTRIAVYGQVHFDRAIWAQAKREYEQKLLVHALESRIRYHAINLAEQDKWGPLCTFLGIPQPAGVTWPHIS